MRLSKTAKPPRSPRSAKGFLISVPPIRPHSNIPLAKLGALGGLAVPSNAVVHLILSVLRQSGGRDSACSPAGIAFKVELRR